MRTDKIGINISKLRIERGITQEQLGRDGIVFVEEV